MRLLWFLSALGVFGGLGSGAMTLNSVQLGPAQGGGASAPGHAHRGRRRRSWVWNQFFVLEEFSGDEPLYVGKLHSDLDRGHGQVRYVLSGEGAASLFSIDESTGDIHATRRLDREQQAYYTLRAQARDRLTDRPLEPESQFVIKVQDVNDNEPEFPDGPYTARVAERSPAGTSVVAVVATDADDPTYGNSARLTYSLLQGQPYFSVEPRTGVVRTAVPDLDREVRDTHLLVVQAKDMVGQVGGLSGTTSVTVIVTDVNDNPPRFPRSESTLVLQVEAVGVEPAHPAGYPWVPVCVYLCVPVCTCVYLCVCICVCTCVYLCVCTCVCTCVYLCVCTCVCVPVCVPVYVYLCVCTCVYLCAAAGSYQFSVPESERVWAVVARIRAVDLDEGPNADLDYRVLDGDGLGTFSISTDSHTQEGLVTLHKTLDFETKSSYRLRVEVSNPHVDARFLPSGPFSDVATLRLLVQNVDEPPVFQASVSRMAVSEAAAVGTKVGSVGARDPDATGSPIRYSIDRRSNPESLFSIDALTGVITTAQPLDRETVAAHNITVVATESLDPAQTGRAVVLISVTDVNDNPPGFATQDDAFVCEDAEVGQTVQTLRAVDRDEPEEEQHVQFSLSGGAVGSRSFTLRDHRDNTASILTRRGGFLRREQPVHLLAVVVADSSSPPLSSTTTLSVTVCTCDAAGEPQSCRQGAPAQLLRSLRTAVSAAVLTCVLSLTGVAVAVVTARRRRREPLIVGDERAVGENIVCYDDEGGGEEDTEAFSMLALRPQAPVDHTPGPGPHGDRLFEQLIGQRLQRADLDSAAPPYDSLQTYALEGSASSAASLSSAHSLDSSNSREAPPDYDFLKEWGPPFRKLADLYGRHEGGATAL